MRVSTNPHSTGPFHCHSVTPFGHFGMGLDRSQSVFYFVPQEFSGFSVKQARLPCPRSELDAAQVIAIDDSGFFQFPKMINLNIFSAPRNHFMYCIFSKLDLSSSSNYLKYKLTNRLDLSCQTLCILQKKESFEGREEGALISKRHGPVFCNRRYLQKYQHSRQIENNNLGFNSDRCS